MAIDITHRLDTLVIGARGRTEILQNVAVILGTVKGTVPLDREFGLDITFLDSPLPVARARFSAEVATEIEKQEPRVRVTRVDFDETPDAGDGILFPRVSVEIREDA